MPRLPPQPPTGPKPPSGQPPRAPGQQRVPTLLRASPLSSMRCCGALAEGNGDLAALRGGGRHRAEHRPALGAGSHASESPGRGPCLCRHPRGRSRPGAGPAGPPPRPSPRPWELALPRALSPQRPGQQVQGGDVAGPNSTCWCGSNALSADRLGRGRDGTGREAVPTIDQECAQGPGVWAENRFMVLGGSTWGRHRYQGNCKQTGYTLTHLPTWHLRPLASIVCPQRQVDGRPGQGQQRGGSHA